MLLLKLFQPKENGCFMEQSFSRKSESFDSHNDK